MNAFFVALNAVFPFLVYLTLGYFIRTIGSADEPFFRRLNEGASCVELFDIASPPRSAVGHIKRNLKKQLRNIAGIKYRIHRTDK